MTPPDLVVYSFPLLLFLALWAALWLPLARIALGLKALTKIAAARIGNIKAVQRAMGHARWKGLRAYGPMLAVIFLGGVLAIVAGFLFITLARELSLSSSAVYRIDRGVRAWFLEARQPGTTAVLRSVTFFGGAAGLLIVMAIVTGLLLVRKERASAAYVVITTLGGMLLNIGLKMFFARDRPEMDIHFAVASWYSFPSGHAMGSFVLYAALAYIGLRQPFPWSVDSGILAAAFTMILLIGLSRVYLGVHWSSDIAGGWSAGAVWSASTTMAFEMLLRQRQRRRGARVPVTPVADIPDKPLPTGA